MPVTIDHIFTWPVGQWRGKGHWNLLDTPAVRNIVADATHSERKIFGIDLISDHNRLDITHGATQSNVLHIVHGICVESDQIYGMPFVADESYQFAVNVSSGTTVDGEWREHNYATGHIQITTTGVTTASEQDKIVQHDHPHAHRDYLQTFNMIIARLAALEAHHPPPAGDDDDSGST